MSDCDGWFVLRRLKADSELSKIPVIMVTIVDNEAMGLDLGAANYLIKPVDRDRLAVLIEKHRIARSSITTEIMTTPVSRSHDQKHNAEVECWSSPGDVNHAETLTSRRQCNEPGHAVQTAPAQRIFRRHSSRW